MKPVKFDGRTPLDEFIIAFENCAQFNRWSPTDKAAYLRNSLTGSAAQLLRDSASSSYGELLAKLERRYGTQNQQERYRTEVRCRRRKKDEPVTELAEAIRGLMMLAYPGDQANEICMSVARDAFLSALNDPEMEENIRRREPRDLDEACRIAQRYEIIHNAVQTNPTDQRPHRARQVNEAIEETEDSSQQAKSETRYEKPRWRNRPGLKTNGYETRATKQQEKANPRPVEAGGEQAQIIKDLVKQCADKDHERAEQNKEIERLRKKEEEWNQEKDKFQRALGRKESVEAARNLVPAPMTPPAGQVNDAGRWQRGPPRRNDGGCFNCGANDHWRRDCPQPLKPKRNPDNLQGNQENTQTCGGKLGEKAKYNLTVHLLWVTTRRPVCISRLR